MDLYPEIAKASGILKRPWLGSVAAYLDKRNCEKAEQVIVLSDDMADTVRDRGVTNPNVTVINNFVIDKVNPDFQLSPHLTNQPERFRVIFAGNLGRFQSLETIIEAAEKLKDIKQIEFLFVGSGVMVDALKKQAGDMLSDTVHFFPYMPISEVMSVLAESHLGIVSLMPGIIHSAFPSKTMSYLEAGCKILAIVEPNSDLADLVEDESLGVICGQRTGEAVAHSIAEMYQHWQGGNYDRAAIQDAAHRHFSQEVILDRWTKLINSISI